MLYDRELQISGGFGDRVMVYSVDAADPQPYTSWEAGVDAGQQWREARLNTSLVIRVPSYDNATTTAKVQVCHWSEAKETSCGDGLDNDCDGRIDADDPDCSGGGGGGSSPEGDPGPATTTIMMAEAPAAGGGRGAASGMPRLPPPQQQQPPQQPPPQLESSGSQQQPGDFFGNIFG
jgi:hypothetical protein